MENDERGDEYGEKHKSRVKKAMIERGFGLELDTYLALKKRGWLVAMQTSFADVLNDSISRSAIEQIRDTWNAPSKPTYRTIDATAVRFLDSNHPQVVGATLILVVECKWRKDENWVFYTESKADNQSVRFLKAFFSGLGVKNPDVLLGMTSYGEFSFFGEISKTSQGTLESELAQKIRASSHHALSNISKIALSHVTIMKKTEVDNITGACLQVLDACSYHGSTLAHITEATLKERQQFSYWRMYPVVVFAGSLWEALFDPEGYLDISPLRWTTYHHPYKGRLHSIDIVSYNALPEYLDTVDKETVLLGRVLSESTT